MLWDSAWNFPSLLIVSLYLKLMSYYVSTNSNPESLDCDTRAQTTGMDTFLLLLQLTCIHMFYVILSYNVTSYLYKHLSYEVQFCKLTWIMFHHNNKLIHRCKKRETNSEGNLYNNLQQDFFLRFFSFLM